MKITRKIFLLITLICMSTVMGFADEGEMGNGTRSCETCLVQTQPDIDNKNQKKDITSNDEEITDFDYYTDVFKSFLLKLLS